MSDGPSIARVGALIGDHARAEILAALAAGQALTATELASIAGVTKQTASAHLAKLVEAKLVAVEAQGRHRYFRLAGSDVAHLLECLMGVAFRTGAVRLRSGPREPALRKARVCYDHLAGELGVLAFESMRKKRFVGPVRGAADGSLELSVAGRRFFREAGMDIDGPPSRRPLCRSCLDWSERRHHLAGRLGAALLARCFEAGWARRTRGSRIVQFTPAGERAFRERFE
jgi:DNA-binding transcriptional ArsR family regulator